MNKIFRILIIFFITGFLNSVYADTTTTGGAIVNIEDSDERPGITFTPSANTLISWNTTATAYYIGSASSKTTPANGIEYAMVSNYNGYYQKIQTEDESKITVSGTPGTAPVDWTPMGGKK